MYKISIPVMNDSLTPETRESFLELLKEAEIERIFIVLMQLGSTEEETADALSRLHDSAKFFKDNGIEPCAWLGSTIGHGAALVAPGADKLTNSEKTLVDLSGNAVSDTHCPLDESFRKTVSRQVAMIAETGVTTVLLDDDLRLSVHGNEYCCACDEHLALMSEYAGETVTREMLKEKAFTGKPNKYRDAWLKAQGDSLRQLCREMRSAVDKVAPSVRLAPCSPPSVWEIDGSSTEELSRILAGNNPPLARLIGAPYWANNNSKSFASVVELERAVARFFKDSGIETMAEGDVYPRPSYNCPSSLLELFDGVIRADGNINGILKYMAGYTTSSHYDIGYYQHHNANKSLMKGIEDIFKGKSDCGVYAPVGEQLLKDADLSLGAMTDWYTWALAGSALGSLSIPTSYEDNGFCCALFGENARRFPKEALGKGAILDGVGAAILQERGVDVGLAGEPSVQGGRVGMVSSPDGRDQATLCGQSGRFFFTELSERAEVLLYFTVNGKRTPLLYRYENNEGQRFAVVMTDTMARHYSSNIFRGFLMQTAMTEAAEWIAKEPLPASCMGNPDLYIICKKDESSMSVALFNCFADSILAPKIKLNRPYSSISFIGCDGRLDGDTVYLNAPLHAYQFAAFEVHGDARGCEGTRGDARDAVAF